VIDRTSPLKPEKGEAARFFYFLRGFIPRAINVNKQ